MLNALKIRPNGIVEAYQIDPKDMLKSVQEGVGGYVQSAGVLRKKQKGEKGWLTVYVNEDGMSMNLPFNCYAVVGDHSVPLYGDLIVCRATSFCKVCDMTPADIESIYITDTAIRQFILRTRAR